MTIIQDLQLDIGIRQLKCTLTDLGYHHRIARRRPFLKKLYRKRRLQFAKRHAHFTVEDWKAIIRRNECQSGDATQHQGLGMEKGR
jgi:Transposase